MHHASKTAGKLPIAAIDALSPRAAVVTVLLERPFYGTYATVQLAYLAKFVTGRSLLRRYH